MLNLEKSVSDMEMNLVSKGAKQSVVEDNEIVEKIAESVSVLESNVIQLAENQIAMDGDVMLDKLRMVDEKFRDKILMITGSIMNTIRAMIMVNQFKSQKYL